MSQYTSTQTLNNNAVNATLNTETNQVTFTVTLSTGNIITVTGNNDSTVFSQLEAEGISSTSTAYLLAARAIRDVRLQAAATETISAATGEPPPAEKQAIPTNNTVDPAVPPAEPSPEAVTDYEPLKEPPDPNPGEYDEFAGLDAAVAANENALQEPPLLTDEEIEQQFPPPPDEYVAPTDAELQNWAKGTSAPKTNLQAQATNQDQVNFTKQEDWRVRLSLSPTANYLYKSKTPGILEPLANTNGVIFPYTPSIQVSYAANYDATDLVHANYKVYQYKNSAVDNIQITCDFTAQDTYEANYLLAVIHFFRSVTKMFYGQDNGPKPGTPPPLCFLTGLGAYQFNEHPLAITSFTYSLPTDVDYIRAGQITSLAGVNTNIRAAQSEDLSTMRLRGVKPGGSPLDTYWGTDTSLQATVTYVPTKMQIQIGAIPMLSRNDVSNNFSLTDYATGKLLRGIQKVRGGFW